MPAIPPEHLRAVTGPDQVSQSTAVEQARAVAEVQAAVVVAHERPRHVDHCRSQLRMSCEMPAMAERAFYAYPRGNATITGASVALAREVARCWGNVQHGVRELRRHAGWSEMQAWAWDMEANTRAVSDFIVYHVRDTSDGSTPLTSQRDVRESLQAMAGRAVREAIFQVIPAWFCDEAEDICRATLGRGSDGDGPTIEDRALAAVGLFSQFGVDQARIEARFGKALTDWTVYDIVQLKATFRSLTTGEMTVDQAFPIATGGPAVTAAEITGGASA
ncbi:MAG: hypothetical protein AAF547_06525 [Actinomycetota bacterium]